MATFQQIYDGVNAYEQIVPIGVSAVDFELNGAGGGAGGRDADSHAGGDGGNGAKVTGTVAVQPGQTLRLYVGQGGRAGATHASNGGGGGGGAWAALYLDDDLVAIAGGGGGGGGGLQNATDNSPNGGDGGGSPHPTWGGSNGTALLGPGGGRGGNDGTGGVVVSGGGSAGTQYNGGDGGPSPDALGGVGEYDDNSRGNGGRGGVDGSGTTIAGAGGGGGGWGGGSGGGLTYWGGGGGGGSYYNPLLVTNESAVRGGGSAGADGDVALPDHGSDGTAILSWEVSIPADLWLEPQITPEFAAGETVTLTWDTAAMLLDYYDNGDYPSVGYFLYEADVIVLDGSETHLLHGTLVQRLSTNALADGAFIRGDVGFEINAESGGVYELAHFTYDLPDDNLVVSITPHAAATAMRVAISLRLVAFRP